MKAAGRLCDIGLGQSADSTMDEKKATHQKQPDERHNIQTELQADWQTTHATQRNAVSDRRVRNRGGRKRAQSSATLHTRDKTSMRPVTTVRGAPERTARQKAECTVQKAAGPKKSGANLTSASLDNSDTASDDSAEDQEGDRHADNDA